MITIPPPVAPLLATPPPGVPVPSLVEPAPPPPPMISRLGAIISYVLGRCMFEMVYHHVLRLNPNENQPLPPRPPAPPFPPPPPPAFWSFAVGSLSVAPPPHYLAHHGHNYRLDNLHNIIYKCIIDIHISWCTCNSFTFTSIGILG